MSRPASWLLELPAITAKLQRGDPRALLRSPEVAELLGGLGRAQVSRLMRSWGAVKVGRDLVIDRQGLLAELRKETSVSHRPAVAKRAELVEAVAAAPSKLPPATLDRYVVRLPSKRTPVQRLADLPSQVQWLPGSLAIAYPDGPRALLDGLVAVVEALILCRAEIAAREEGWPEAIPLRYSRDGAPVSREADPLPRDLEAALQRLALAREG